LLPDVIGTGFLVKEDVGNFAQSGMNCEHWWKRLLRVVEGKFMFLSFIRERHPKMVVPHRSFPPAKPNARKSNPTSNALS